MDSHLICASQEETVTRASEHFDAVTLKHPSIGASLLERGALLADKGERSDCVVSLYSS
jgi:hypothetical protein